MVDTQDGQWKATVIQQVAAPGIDLEMLVTHPRRQDRLIIFSSRTGDVQPDSLTRFAHRLVDAFTAYTARWESEQAATAIGWEGRNLRFELSRARQTLDCSLFVFLDGTTAWAVLHACPPGAPSDSLSPLTLLHRSVAAPADAVPLPPYRVKSTPISQFPISFDVFRQPRKERLDRLVVIDVPVESSTARAGVKVGDEIIAIDGRKVSDFAPGVGKDSELGRIFLNRHPGDKVTLEILSSGSATPFSVTLRIAGPLDFILPAIP